MLPYWWQGKKLVGSKTFDVGSRLLSSGTHALKYNCLGGYHQDLFELSLVPKES